MTAKKKKPDPVEGTFLNLRAYARHRAELKLSGQTHAAVTKAIASARLVDSVHETPKGIRIDPQVADREWEENTTGTKRRESAGGRPSADSLFDDDELPTAKRGTGGKTNTLQSAVTLGAVYKARLLRLDFETREGRLVDRDTVQNEAFRLARLVRENLMKIPGRLSSRLAPLDDPREIRAMIETELVMALETLDV